MRLLERALFCGVEFILENSVDRAFPAESLMGQGFREFPSNCSADNTDSPKPALTKDFSVSLGLMAPRGRF